MSNLIFGLNLGHSLPFESTTGSIASTSRVTKKAKAMIKENIDGLEMAKIVSDAAIRVTIDYSAYFLKDGNSLFSK